MTRTNSAPLRYGAAVLFVVLATILRIPLNAALGDDVPFIFYFPAAALGAWYGGFGPGLLATFLGALLAWYFYIPPYYSFAIANSLVLVQIGLFLSLSSFISYLTEAAQKALRRAEESEKQAREQREQLRRSALASYQLGAIVTSSDDAIISKTLDGIITSWNAAAEKLFGYSAEETVGKHISILIPEDRLYEEMGILEKLRQGQRIQHFETIRIRKDGRLIEVSLSISPIKDREARVMGAAKIARDITARKQAQIERDRLLASEQQARAQAEEASRLKDEFLANVSHELRTPLNAILGWARLMRAGHLDAPQSQQAIETIERSARAQAQLIEDLLDVSRIISGKLRLDVSPVMVSAVVESALASVKPMAEARGVKLQAILDPNAGPVAGDSGRIQQVVWNLLSNAIKFTPRGGRVQVRVERVNSHLEIIVSDTGKGISPEFLPHVFERFRQAEGGTTRQYGGLGLGLAIVRHLVELHGGMVTAESPGLGQGATFTVQLPLMVIRPRDEREEKEERVYPAAETTEALTLDSPPDLDNVKVLVIDDEPDTRLLLRTVLEQCGAEVRDASSSEEGLREARQWRPTIIVSDIGMPGEDGYHFIRQLREWEKESGIRTLAIALTAFARTEDRMRALSAGYHTHIAKPVEPMEFALVIASLVGRGPKTA